MQDLGARAAVRIPGRRHAVVGRSLGRPLLRMRAGKGRARQRRHATLQAARSPRDAGSHRAPVRRALPGGRWRQAVQLRQEDGALAEEREPDLCSLWREVGEAEGVQWVQDEEVLLGGLSEQGLEGAQESMRQNSYGCSARFLISIQGVWPVNVLLECSSIQRVGSLDDGHSYSPGSVSNT